MKRDTGNVILGSGASEYQALLNAKIAVDKPRGLVDVSAADLHPIMKPHQGDIALWMLRGGRRGVFAQFGLGKTILQLWVLHILHRRIGGRVMVVCPLGVMGEFKADACKLGITVQYVRTDAEMSAADADVLLTNYERIREGCISREMIDTLTAVSLDEASVLRSYGSKTYQEFLPIFDQVSYRYVCTATPAPNRYKELIHYAGFLGIMDTGQALTRFFQRDSTRANNLTLYPNQEREFWLWMASWSVFVTKPSDLGHDDTGYDLPPLNVTWHEVAVDHTRATADRDGQGRLFRDGSQSMQAMAHEAQLTMPQRVARAAEIVAMQPDKHWCIWHDLEPERAAIMRAVPGCVDVYGSQDLDERERRLMGFANGEIKILATKPSIAGSGCNFQRHCHNAVFVGVGYKFNDFIQAVHRFYRFLQPEAVNIHIVYAESQREIRRVLEAKWAQHNELVSEMTSVIREHGLNRGGLVENLAREMGVERTVKTGELWTAVHNDCVDETRRMESDSVDLIVTSIPFGNHYEYSANYNDFGHNADNDAFWRQMDHLTPELLRVLKPGRIYACHVKDRIRFGNVTGYGCPTVDVFHAEALFHARKHGFVIMGMVTIETDVVRENNQTYRLSWREQRKDGTKMGVGCPEYLLIFRKLPSDTSKGYADTPVCKDEVEYPLHRWQVDARAKWNSSGNRLLTPVEIASLPLEAVDRWYRGYMDDAVYDYGHHLSVTGTLADVDHLPKIFESVRVNARTGYVWSDVTRMRTLNGEQTLRQQTNHICPLQFDIVDRAIDRWSNPGELVYDPFGGIMTVPYRAVLRGRYGYGVELNADYHRDGCRYLEEAERNVMSPTLFDIDGGAE